MPWPRRLSMLVAAAGMSIVAACGGSAGSSGTGPAAAPAPSASSRPGVTASSDTATPSAMPSAMPSASRSPARSPKAAPRPSKSATAVFPRPARLPLRVEVWGDSHADQAKDYISYYIGLGGKATSKIHTYGGTALCDWFADMRLELDPANPASFRPQAVAIQFSGNTFTPCMQDANGRPLTGQALIAKYRADAETVIRMFTAVKIPVYFVSTPISRADAALGYVGLTPLDVMYSKLPQRFPAGHLVRFADAAAAVEWHGHYTDTLPCLAWEKCTGRWPDGTKTVVVRQADGGHFCPVTETEVNGVKECPVYMGGAARFAIAIAHPILADFGLA